ncbi:uncharacterized protein BP5553_08621 [Venustampulla echinocandica]|uniref:Uncharacterized protein n=1 Tax=Venustampulla echinocandica TaxID=2656787 RepID=A0A370TER5_9HELO|nr:uncharacterized protein BP5553_08621 [Venustampulla echinocandica]RDL33182.1 hypothetical protein BP5553_08621 [Venustampulla echinocandica]
MAETSNGRPPVQEGGERAEEQHEHQQPDQQPISEEERLPTLSQHASRDATELTARMRRQYSRASTRRSAPVAINKPTTVLGSGIANFRKFWRRQISITVDHTSARDHLADSNILPHQTLESDSSCLQNHYPVPARVRQSTP